jgi:hypothetical protein
VVCRTREFLRKVEEEAPKLAKAKTKQFSELSKRSAIKELRIKESNYSISGPYPLYQREVKVHWRYKISLRGLQHNLRETLIDATNDVSIFKNRIWFTHDAKYFFIILVGTDKRHLELKKDPDHKEDQFKMRLWKSMTFDTETLVHQPHLDIDFFPSQINCRL